MGMLVEKTIKEYSDLLASNEPTPGGGSTAALAGVLGAALNMMVVNLSFGKKFYEALDEDKKDEMNSCFTKIGQLKDQLMEAIDEDKLAFDKYMEAIKMPKDTEEEKDLRELSMQQAAVYALRVPMEAGIKCLEILKNQKVIAQYGSKGAISDVGVGAFLALAALESAVMNVRINLPSIPDRELADEIEKKCSDMVDLGSKLKTETVEIVYSRIG